MSDIPIKDIQSKIWQLFVLPPVLFLMGGVFGGLILIEEIKAGEMPTEVLGIALGGGAIGFFGVLIVMGFSKSLHFDPARNVLYFKRPLMMGFSGVKIEIGTPTSVEIHWKLFFADPNHYKNFHFLIIKCHDSRDPEFRFDCHSPAEAKAIAQRISEVARCPVYDKTEYKVEKGF